MGNVPILPAQWASVDEAGAFRYSNRPWVLPEKDGIVFASRTNAGLRAG